MDGVEVFADIVDILIQVLQRVGLDVSERVAWLLCYIYACDLPPGLVVADGREAGAGTDVEDS
jgi:hypothetical protein